jgi:hypothetical protein
VAACLMWSRVAGSFAFGGMFALYSIVWVNDRHLPPTSRGLTEL